MGLRLTVVTRTDVGRVRQRNEDAVVAEPDAGAVVVADGMGGHPAGDVASRLAASTALERLTDAASTVDPEPGDPDGMERSSMGDRMARAVRSADERVREAAREDPEKEGMGTTLTAFLADTSSRRWAVGHVGDSRAYRIADGSIEQITRDDSWVQEQVEAGRLTPERARHHHWSSVLSQAIGLTEPAEPSVYEGELEAGVVFLLCTDGLSGFVEDEILLRAVEDRGPEKLEEAADALVEAAWERGAPDNVTVALCRVDGDG